MMSFCVWARMPKLNGPGLYREPERRIRADMPIIFFHPTRWLDPCDDLAHFVHHLLGSDLAVTSQLAEQPVAYSAEAASFLPDMARHRWRLGTWMYLWN